MGYSSGSNDLSKFFNEVSILGKGFMDALSSISNPHAVNAMGVFLAVAAAVLFWAIDDKHKLVESRMPGGRDGVTRKLASASISLALAMGVYIMTKDIYGDAKGQTPSWVSKDKPIVNANGSTVSKSCTVTLPGLPPPPPPAKPC